MATNTMFEVPLRINPTTGQLERWDAASGAYVAVGGDPLMPAGLDWLTDTISGFDIYERGFVKRPNIFVDWNASSSLGLGTFKNPYTTPAQVMGRINNMGNLKGVRLGLKRGSKLSNQTSVGANGIGRGDVTPLQNAMLCLDVYSSDAGDPFMVIPYGDAEALPIISGERLTGTGTSYVWSAHAGNIYKVAVDYHCHAWHTQVTTDGLRRSQMKSSLAGVVSPGHSYWDGTYLYLWPWGNENPNLGQYVLNYGFCGMQLRPANVAAAGNVIVAGLDVRYARNMAVQVSHDYSASIANITSLPNWNIVGCRLGMSGRDASSYAGDGNGANSILSWFAKADNCRFNAYVAGNELYEGINNCVEWTGTDNTVFEYNYGHEVGGNLLENYGSNSNTVGRFNKLNVTSKKYLDEANGHPNRLNTGPSNAGVWLSSSNKITAPYIVTEYPADHTVNVNNKFYGNLLLDTPRGCKVETGNGHVFSHNTLIATGNSPRLAAENNGRHGFQTLLAIGTSAAQMTGHTNMSNNLFYCNEPLGSIGGVVVGDTFGKLPSGDGNIYFCTGDWAINWKINTVDTVYNLADFKAHAQVIAAGLDQVKANANTAGGTLTLGNLAFNETTFQVGAASVAVGNGKASLNLPPQYRLGNVRSDAAPTAGSEGTA